MAARLSYNSCLLYKDCFIHLVHSRQLHLQDHTAASQAGSGTAALLDVFPQTNSNSSKGQSLRQSTSFNVLELMRQRLPVYIGNCFLVAGCDVPEVISNMDVSENPGSTIN